MLAPQFGSIESVIIVSINRPYHKEKWTIVKPQWIEFVLLMVLDGVIIPADLPLGTIKSSNYSGARHFALTFARISVPFRTHLGFEDEL